MKSYKFYTICILLIVVSAGLINAKFSSKAIAHERLMKDILNNYDPNIRPNSQDERLLLKVHLELHHFKFIESKGSFELIGKFFVNWFDQKLRWSPNDYNNITAFNVPNLTIWVPDIEIYNNSPDKFLRMHDKGMVLVENSGSVTWTDTIELMGKTICSTETMRWPKDRHKCALSLGSWTYDGALINFDNSTLNATGFPITEIAKNPEFIITNHTVEYTIYLYSCCVEPYVTLTYHLEFERRASFAIVFQMPALCVVLLTLGAFCLEPQRGEKFLLLGISILLSSLQLIYFAKNMKHFQLTRSLPMCVIFHVISMILVTLASILSVFSLWASHSKLKSHLPPGFMKLLKSRLGSLLDTRPTHGLKPDNTEGMHPQFEDVKLQEYSNLILKDMNPDEWTRFAFVVERIGAGVYGLIFLLLATVCLL